MYSFNDYLFKTVLLFFVWYYKIFQLFLISTLLTFILCFYVFKYLTFLWFILLSKEHRVTQDGAIIFKLTGFVNEKNKGCQNKKVNCCILSNERNPYGGPELFFCVIDATNKLTNNSEVTE